MLQTISPPGNRMPIARRTVPPVRAEGILVVIQRRRYKLLRKALFPVVFAATAMALLLAPDAPIIAQASRGYPYVALVACVLIAWRLQRSRIVIAGLALLAMHIALQPFALGNDIIAFALAATFLPPGIALLALTRDRRLLAPGTATQFAATFGPITIAAFVAISQTEQTLALFSYPLDMSAAHEWRGLPNGAIIAGTIAMAVLLFSAFRSRRPVEAGLAWMMIAMILALAAPVTSVARGLWVLAGALVLVIAAVEASYVMAFHDELTGLPGRRALADAVAMLRPPYAIAIVDVDHFKSFNDKHGHAVGDQVLCMVAAKLAGVTGGGTAYRSGGEEFTIVFPGSNKTDAWPHLEAVREAVAGARFTLRTLPRPRQKKGVAQRGKSQSTPRQKQLKVTVSVGVASPGRAIKDALDVIKAADKAMYRAKQGGRNQVVA